MDTCIVPTCRHILGNGCLCRCAASRGKSYCRHHLDSTVRHRKMARARRRRLPLWMPPLMAAAGLRGRINCLQIALEAGDLDLQNAEKRSSRHFACRTPLSVRSSESASRGERLSPFGSIKCLQVICFYEVALEMAPNLLKTHLEDNFTHKSQTRKSTDTKSQELAGTNTATFRTP
jgi:hypothetical protein